MFEDSDALCLSVLYDLVILSTVHSQDSKSIKIETHVCQCKNPNVVFLDCIPMTQLSQICIKVFFEVKDLILV